MAKEEMNLKADQENVLERLKKYLYDSLNQNLKHYKIYEIKKESELSAYYEGIYYDLEDIFYILKKKNIINDSKTAQEIKNVDKDFLVKKFTEGMGNDINEYYQEFKKLTPESVEKSNQALKLLKNVFNVFIKFKIIKENGDEFYERS